MDGGIGEVTNGDDPVAVSLCEVGGEGPISKSQQAYKRSYRLEASGRTRGKGVELELGELFMPLPQLLYLTRPTFAVPIILLSAPYPADYVTEGWLWADIRVWLLVL